MIRYTGVNGVTVARGAIGNPWIFAQTRALATGMPLPAPPSLFEQRDVICEHYRLAEELYGPDRCLPDMRKFAIKYSQLHPRHEEVRADFCQVRQSGAWRGVLEKWYATDEPGTYPPAEEHNPRASEAVRSDDGVDTGRVRNRPLLLDYRGIAHMSRKPAPPGQPIATKANIAANR
jgi:hypothetical protein